jgi:uncharacterized repeat protein (TIGR01451 family)
MTRISLFPAFFRGQDRPLRSTTPGGTMSKTLFRSLLATLALALAVPALQAHAQQPALSVSAENRTAQAEAAAGSPRRDAHAHPGDVLRYRLTFNNSSGRALRGVTLADPIPAGVSFVAGSARSARDDARAEYSADAGRSFSAQPMEDAVENGQRVRRAVPAARYTHVRWTVEGAVAPGAAVVAEFEARVTAGNQSPSSADRR